MSTRDRKSKRCPGCQKRKRVTSFHLSRTRHDGRQPYCKACNKEKRK